MLLVDSITAAIANLMAYGMMFPRGCQRISKIHADSFHPRFSSSRPVSPSPLFSSITPNPGLAHLKPAELARALSHLEGLIWLDSSEPASAAFSLITAAPTRWLEGTLPQDWQLLEASLQQGRRSLGDQNPSAPRLPGAGLYGAVRYDGRFTLGHYPHALVFDHRSRTWYEQGDLSRQIRPQNSPQTTASPLQFTPQVSQKDFIQQVQRAKQYIAAGDIYQVNLSYPWLATPVQAPDLLSLYSALRRHSPAPYAAYLHLPSCHILSSSPELFLKMDGQHILTRPIKGTRPRFPADPAADQAALQDLQSSAKERAELLMITDLLRNDLGQICDYGSVHVDELWKTEIYPQVFHLVSSVSGSLRPELSHARALAACFPGGSITGAPKKRAMQIIRELEPHARGFYTGSIGGFSFNHSSHWNIAIRTLIARDGQLCFHTGAGIVADSEPELEHQETLHKAAGILMLQR
jgi:para-aminobenzoate synthetase component 1